MGWNCPRIVFPFSFHLVWMWHGVRGMRGSAHKYRGVSPATSPILNCQRCTALIPALKSQADL